MTSLDIDVACHNPRSLRLWQALAAGNIDQVEAEDRQPGYG
ncbi:MAG: hypothetical protein QOG43_1059 [Actinomycetota bacterium]|jgi:hypothetical protein|nr:hypothetical protein [Actinomycetota bacterium]